MIDVLNEIEHVHGVRSTWQHAGSERLENEGASTVNQVFEVHLFAGDREAVLRLFTTDDVAAGILRPHDHPHYPLRGNDLLTWKLWTTIFDDADEQIRKAPEERGGYWRYAEHIFGRDELVKLLAIYRQTVKQDIETGIPTRLRYVHESGHRLSNTGRTFKGNPHGTYLFRCVDCKRIARMCDFREHDCEYPAFIDLEYRDEFRQLVIRFVHRINHYESPDFAIWHRGADQVVLHAAEGAVLGSLDVLDGADTPLDDLLALVIDEWGSLASVQFSMHLYT
ncbi:hypothetical protein AB0H73_06360 [Streptomyces olivoreticuli]